MFFRISRPCNAYSSAIWHSQGKEGAIMLHRITHFILSVNKMHWYYECSKLSCCNVHSLHTYIRIRIGICTCYIVVRIPTNIHFCTLRRETYTDSDCGSWILILGSIFSKRSHYLPLLAWLSVSLFKETAKIVGMEWVSPPYHLLELVHWQQFQVLSWQTGQSMFIFCWTVEKCLKRCSFFQFNIWRMFDSRPFDHFLTRLNIRN